MKLTTLIQALEQDVDTQGIAPQIRVPEGQALSDVEISGIHYRAQDVEPDGLFVAIQGFKADGHAFVDQAVDRGASAVVVQREAPRQVPTLKVANSRMALSALAARFYGDVSSRLFVIGVTGTNGKTTTAYMIEKALAAAGHQVGMIGTIDWHFKGRAFSNPVTTPESLDLMRMLHQMALANVTHVVMEVSSHALDLLRVAHCRFDVAVFTNLTQDHLDFHGDMQTYWASKKQLFTRYLVKGPKKDRALAVINVQDPRGRELAREMGERCIRVGPDADCLIRPDQVSFDLDGTRGRLHTPGGGVAFTSSLIGRHNLENMLCAAGAAYAAGLSEAHMRTGIQSLVKVDGRLEAVPNTVGRFVFVDYAHTPDALENILTAMVRLARNRIICVFGCGGDRDRGKRPLMGAIAARYSDLCVVTSDNPRSETPEAIIDDILGGMDGQNLREYAPDELDGGFGPRGWVRVPDRRQAIKLGIGASRPGDIVLIAGKGHETYQILKDRRIDFDDRLEAAKALEQLP